MATGKTVGGRSHPEIRDGTSAMKSMLQGQIQHGRSDHNYNKEGSSSLQVKIEKQKSGQCGENGHGSHGTEQRQSLHNPGQRRGREGMDSRAHQVVEASGIAFQDFFGQPAEKEQSGGGKKKGGE